MARDDRHDPPGPGPDPGRDTPSWGARPAKDAGSAYLALRSDTALAEHCRRAARRDLALILVAFLLAAVLAACAWYGLRGDPEPFPSLLNMPPSRRGCPEGGATGS